jgi:outer membrane protein OmpA-like peptidoglycan-associated protein
MRTLIWITLMILVGGMPSADAQLLKKLGKVAERAAEKTVERRVANETSKKTDQVLDSILEPGKKGKENYPQSGGNNPKENSDSNPSSPQSGDGNNPDAGNNPGSGELEVYSKFDFVPGDNQIFFDDYANDFIGDFPSNWNTNGTGEVVTIGTSDQKWMELKPGYGITFIPDVPDLPEEYTIEFDLMARGLDRLTTSTAVLKVGVSDNKSFKWGNFATVDIPFCQYSPVGFFVRNGGDINNNIEGDIRDKVLGQPHISIAVNKQRFRLWVDEGKYVDIPRMIPAGINPTTLKFELRQFKDGKERLFIGNLRVAEGGVDLRRKLVTEGKISTNGILFDSGSDNLLPQSMGIIRQISQVLSQESGMRLRIVGHTDSDGTDATNRDLSKRRAQAVKNALVSIYNIDQNRLQADGKGEAQPVADNNTLEGKAQNRRVEFIKI